MDAHFRRCLTMRITHTFGKCIQNRTRERWGKFDVFPPCRQAFSCWHHTKRACNSTIRCTWFMGFTVYRGLILWSDGFLCIDVESVSRGRALKCHHHTSQFFVLLLSDQHWTGRQLVATLGQNHLLPGCGLHFNGIMCPT